MRDVPNPRVIAWAVERIGKKPEDLTSSFPRILEWIKAEGRPPTTRQIELLAKKTHVLSFYFYEDDIPNLSLQIPDFRTMDAGRPQEPSPELYDAINQASSRQDWLREYLKDIDERPLKFIGCCKNTRNIAESSTKMRRLLNLEPDWARGKQSSAAVRELRKRIEALGVCVFAGSYFGNNTKRSFNEREFRGFVLTDQYAPIIFLNTKDTYTAQLFTLAHEFAHLLFNETGVDDATFESREKIEEDKCDSLAAEFLVPTTLVRSTFNELPLDKALERLQQITCVSQPVVLRRAKELGFISRREFLDRYETYINELPEMLECKKARSNSHKINYINLAKNHLGSLFPERIFVALQSENLLYSDAYRLTGMNAKTFNKFFKPEGVAV